MNPSAFKQPTLDLKDLWTLRLVFQVVSKVGQSQSKKHYLVCARSNMSVTKRRLPLAIIRSVAASMKAYASKACVKHEVDRDLSTKRSLFSNFLTW